MKLFEGLDRRQVLGWALYDWANSAFATVVMAGFFPLFFKSYYWPEGAAGPTDSTYYLGLANSVASIIVAVMSPVLGAIADRWTAKKRFLAFFMAAGSLATGALALVAAGEWRLAALLYMLGVIGFSAANAFYDALLVSVAPARKLDVASALGYALGYLGGGVVFGLNVAMYLRPGWFGLDGPTTAVRVSFFLVAVWWLVFSLPILLWVPEPMAGLRERGSAAVLAGLRQLGETMRDLRRLKVVVLFLCAYWLYIDGVDTVIRMALAYGMDVGFPVGSLILALLLVQFVGFPAALAFGRLGERLGTRRALFIGIGAYVLILAWGARMSATWEFYGLAVAIGLVQGGVQSLSRSFYARLVPATKAAEFFGFFNMLGKFAAIFGPALMGGVARATGSPRLGLFSVVLLFLGGGALLLMVDEDAGRREAAAWDAENPSAERGG